MCDTQKINNPNQESYNDNDYELEFSYGSKAVGLASWWICITTLRNQGERPPPSTQNYSSKIYLGDKQRQNSAENTNTTPKLPNYSSNLNCLADKQKHFNWGYYDHSNHKT